MSPTRWDGGEEEYPHYLWYCDICGGGPWTLQTTPSCLDCGHIHNNICCTHERVFQVPLAFQGLTIREDSPAPVLSTVDTSQSFEGQTEPDTREHAGMIATEIVDISDQDINNRLSDMELLLRKVLRPVELIVTPTKVSGLVNMILRTIRPAVPEGQQRITWTCVSLLNPVPEESFSELNSTGAHAGVW